MWRMVYSRRGLSYMFMLGFLLGILYMNIGAKDDFLSEGFVSDLFAESLSETICEEEYLYDIAYVRVLPCIILFLVSGTKFRKISAIVFLTGTGFLLGFLLSGAVLRMGLRGFVFCIISLLPHMFFYGISYGMILNRMLQDGAERWNATQVSACMILLLAGILLECYISPVLMGIFLRGI